MRAAAFLVTALVAGAAAADEVPPAGSNESRRDEAQRAFNRGLELSTAGAWDAALLEFLRSRAIHSTRNATRNAANALRKLGRYDEAHALYEAVLREFPDALRGERAEVERAVSELAALTGVVVLRGADGAALSVDGRDRGVVSSEPLRLSAGARKLRVSRRGFAPWERPVDVPAHGVVELDVVLDALPPSETVVRDRVVVREVDRSPPPAPQRAAVELAGGVAGGVNVGVGGLVQARLGYAFAPPLSAGLSVGYLRVGRTEEGAATITPFGAPPNTGTAEDSTLIHGGLAGAFAAMRWSPVTLRLGAGALIGRGSAARSGTFRASTGETYPVDVDAGTTWANYLYVAPEARLGLHLAGLVELDVGAAPLLLLALEQPTVSDTEEVVNPDGYATVTIARELAPPVALLLTLDVGVRVSF